MAAKKKRSVNLGKKALLRLFGRQADILTEAERQVSQEAERIEEDADEHFRNIRSGGRRFKRPFRP